MSFEVPDIPSPELADRVMRERPGPRPVPRPEPQPDPFRWPDIDRQDYPHRLPSVGPHGPDDPPPPPDPWIPEQLPEHEEN